MILWFVYSAAALLSALLWYLHHEEARCYVADLKGRKGIPLPLPLQAKALLTLFRLTGGRTSEPIPDVEALYRNVVVENRKLTSLAKFRANGAGDEDPIEPSQFPITYFDTATFRGVFRLLAHNALHQRVVGGVLARVKIEAVDPTVSTTDLMQFNVRTHTASWKPHRRGQEVDINTSVTCVDKQGTPDAAVTELWKSTKTFIFFNKGGAKPDEEPAPEQIEFARIEKGEATSRGVDVSASFRTASSDGVEYAAICGDSNPIHVSKLGAKLFGFCGPIAHGMCIVEKITPALFAGAQKLAEENGKPSNTRFLQKSLEVTFKRPAFLGSELRVEAWKGHEEVQNLYSIEFRVLNRKGGVVQAGKASFVAKQSG